MLPHQLQNQILLPKIPHLIIVLDLKVNDPLKRGLPHSENSSASDMFAKQHAEIRRLHRAELILFRKVNQRERSGSRQKDAPLPARRFHRQQDLIRLRLRDLADPPSAQSRIHFRNNICNGYSVKCHNKTPSFRYDSRPLPHRP